jgi:hypothetical protein
MLRSIYITKETEDIAMLCLPITRNLYIGLISIVIELY